MKKGKKGQISIWFDDSPLLRFFFFYTIAIRICVFVLFLLLGLSWSFLGGGGRGGSHSSLFLRVHVSLFLFVLFSFSFVNANRARAKGWEGYSKLVRRGIITDLADNVVSFAEECIPLIQDGLVLVVQVAPFGNAIFGFQARKGQGTRRVFSCKDCMTKKEKKTVVSLYPPCSGRESLS